MGVLNRFLVGAVLSPMFVLPGVGCSTPGELPRASVSTLVPTTRVAPTAAIFLKVRVVDDPPGYKIVGETNLPEGTLIRIAQDDLRRPGAIFDEVPVSTGKFSGPTYTVVGRFKASATARDQSITSNSQTFEFASSGLKLK